MSDTRDTVEVAAGLIFRGNTILLCQRPAHKPLGGFWEFPGGKLEKGETPAQALKRELREELGVEARGITLYAICSHCYSTQTTKMSVRRRGQIGNAARIIRPGCSPKIFAHLFKHRYERGALRKNLGRRPSRLGSGHGNCLKVRLYFMRVTNMAGEPAPREGQNLAWLTPAEALALPVLAADVAVLERLATELP